MAGKILQTCRRDWLSIAAVAADNDLHRDDIVLVARTFADPNGVTHSARVPCKLAAGVTYRLAG